jgi:hypothetical protein
VLNRQLLFEALQLKHKFVELVVRGLCVEGVALLSDFSEIGTAVHRCGSSKREKASVLFFAITNNCLSVQAGPTGLAANYTITQGRWTWQKASPSSMAADNGRQTYASVWT